MQSVRLVIRQVGTPHKGLNVYSAQETSEYIEYQYLSQGYRIQETHYLGDVKGEKGEGVQGYRILFILVAESKPEVVPSIAPSVVQGVETPPVEEKKKPGRPKGS